MNRCRLSCEVVSVLVLLVAALLHCMFYIQFNWLFLKILENISYINLHFLSKTCIRSTPDTSRRYVLVKLLFCPEKCLFWFNSSPDTGRMCMFVLALLRAVFALGEFWSTFVILWNWGFHSTAGPLRFHQIWSTLEKS